MKQIIVDIANDGEIKIVTKGYTGKACLEETKFLKDLLGKEIECQLVATACIHEGQEANQFIPLCG
jgi:hypothetical protein